MNIPNGFHDIPHGKIVAVVTHLQMFGRPPARPGPTNPSWKLEKIESPNIQDYRNLFRRVGQDWLWFSRLQMKDTELAEILEHPLNHTYALSSGGEHRGLLELDYRFGSDCELAFFGLTREMLGQGAGRWLMNRALEIAWSRPIKRFWLHTCTFDHPSAVQFYIRSGFKPYRRELEVLDDPRAFGILPRDSAPHVPFIEKEHNPAVG